MKTSRMAGIKNGLGPVSLRMRIGGAWWLPAIFLLATACTVQAGTYGDYTYTINPNGTIRIDEYTGLGGAVTIPSDIEGGSVVGIGRYAFSDCTNLTSVTIPDSVTYIEEYVFNECTSLAGVMIGKGVTSIGFRVFDYCASLTTITVDALNSSYSSLDGVLFNKSQTTLVQYPGGKAGAYTITASVTNIGKEAFMSCTNLISVTITNSVINIGDAAFRDCTSLTSVTITNSVTSIGMDAFRGCTSLTGVTIPNSVTSIGEWAFYECASLAGITLPASVTNIGEFAFGRCASLTAITVDAGNPAYSSLDGVLFNKSQTTLVQCPSGKAGSYTIPNSVTNIGGEAFSAWPANGLGGFSWCTRLTSVTLPDSVISIGKNAFLYCTGLTGITIPNSVTSIGYFAFENCAGLTSVTIPNRITSIAYWAFSGCTSLTGVTIPNSVTNIEAQAFERCTSLTGVTIPNSVTSIEMSAFGSCTSLAGVTIGAGLANLGEYVFSSCTNLTGVYFRGNAPGDGSNVFYNADLVTVYYLAGTTGWGTTFGGRPTALWNALPEPTIKANGSTDHITVNYPAPVSLTVELNAGSYAGTEVDWWVVAHARSGAWYYLDRDLQWPTFNGNVAFCQPAAQGALANLSPFTVLDRYQLPRGTYDFWFAIDYPMDGILDLNGQYLVDQVTVVVQ